MDLKNSKKISKTVLLGILIITINGFYNSAVVADSSNLKEDTPSAVAILPEDEPVIGDPFLDSENPVSNESVIVTFPIEDPEGIRNATLYWQYHVNDTLYNSTMSETSTRVVNTIVWDRTGKVTDLGVETNDYTGWQFGEYIYESTTELISSIDTIIDISRVDNFLVYVLIEAKNSSTGLWETKDEVGSIGGDTVDLAMYSYTKDELVMGYRIYA
ncbi:MAG: hypothetical protein KAR35_04600, partial [Candidatus Heimdallarchaeota archaeon]|nr:hypothetical protein [Candidatus Heimdallarchaeota archaeon]MCK5048635.1 hypothetical protein [Candidatus Heimdallarchaeota archaeon]